MLKKILSVLAAMLMLGYMIYAIVTFSDRNSEVRCKEVIVVVKDSSEHQFVREAEIRDLLKREHLKLVGKRLKSIDYGLVETAAASHRLVRRAECYSSPSGIVYINVWQHIPIIRMMSKNANYYLDQDGKRTGLSPHSAADVVVATGEIKKALTVRKLYKMALLMQKDPFWDAQIEQISVEPNGEWTLIPRVGDYEILLGLPNNMEEKLQRLRLFYEKGLSKVGWERYSKINLKYENQIVCTKKE
ncbi:MAG: cell division protein FtsQ/DivIB [Bacteroidales bacterium]|nr:cell division protein FtsQ/DivIB [Bacteroidales bacterium]